MGARTFNNKKLFFVEKASRDSTTITLNLDSTENLQIIFFYGRLGYDINKPAFGVIIANLSSGNITACGMDVYSVQTGSVSGSGRVLTITTAQTYAALTFISTNPIS